MAIARIRVIPSLTELQKRMKLAQEAPPEAGLPFAGWSTQHGDLRVGHFAGIHAAQIVPLLGILLLRRREKWLREGHRLALVGIGAGGYLGLVALVTWQALRDQPLLQPDALMLGALAGIIAVTLAAAGATLAHARMTVR